MEFVARLPLAPVMVLATLLGMIMGGFSWSVISGPTPLPALISTPTLISTPMVSSVMPVAIAPTADLRQVYAQIGTMGDLVKANAELTAKEAVATMTHGFVATQVAAIATAERGLDQRLTTRLEIMLTAKPTTSPTPARRICRPGTPEPGVVCYWPTSVPGPTATAQSCEGMTERDYNEWCRWPILTATSVPTVTPTPIFGSGETSADGSITEK